MFISPSVLKKHLKKAYNYGVHIGSLDDGIVITNGHFFIWIDYLKVPNEIKAIVAEFIGIIPDANAGMFKASKDEPFAQAELDIDYTDILNGVLRCRSETINTKIIIDSYGSLIRLYQNSDFNTIIAASEGYIDLFDSDKCDYDHGETRPNMTPYTDNNNTLLYWRNDACKLIILPVDMSANKPFAVITSAMQAVDFEEVSG